VVEAASLQGVVDLAGAVRGDDDDRRRRRLDRAELGNGDLEVAEDLEEIGLEGLVGAVELVDEEDRRAGDALLQRPEDRAAVEEALREHLAGKARAVDVAGRLGEADLDHLRHRVPLVDRGGDVEALIALQADQLAAEDAREDLGDLGLADARLAFEEQRPAHPQGEEQNGREVAPGDVVGTGQEVDRVVDRGGQGLGHQERNRLRGACPTI
jgi:hypothetical protein